MKSKFDVLIDLRAEALSRKYRSIAEALRTVLEQAYNEGYSAGRANRNRALFGNEPLYGIDGKQIREVTQAELDWTP